MKTNFPKSEPSEKNQPRVVSSHSKSVVIWIVLLSALAGILFFAKNLFKAEFPAVAHFISAPGDDNTSGPAKRFNLFAGHESQPTVDMPIISMGDFDFKTKAEILDIRERLIPTGSGSQRESYSPRPEVFGQMADGKPWWGITGAISIADGNHNIDGDSKESQYINNPYLLVGLAEPLSHAVTRVLYAPAKYYCPVLLHLTFDPAHHSGHATYSVAHYREFLDEIQSPLLPAHLMTLNCLNARDFGFDYLFVDPSQSSNVESQNTTGRAVLIQQMIGVDEKCRYAGGCNGLLPEQNELRIDIKALPAKAVVKLWRSDPTDVKNDPDATFVLDMQ